MTGIGGEGGVRCGLIGEVGCSHPLTPHETRSLQAAAAAQQITGETIIKYSNSVYYSDFASLPGLYCLYIVEVVKVYLHSPGPQK